ncbi:MAG: exonuclease domain-containing protein [Myxococcota bacterium]
MSLSSLSLPWKYLPGPLVFVDVETTGVGRADRVVELAAIRVAPDEPVQVLNTLIDPGVRPVGAAHVHRITGEVLDGAPAFESVVPALAQLSDGATLVAHNASFEQRMLSGELARLGGVWGVPALCTYALSRRAHPERNVRGARTLTSLVNLHRLTMDGHAHAAWPDARVLPELLVCLLNRAESAAQTAGWIRQCIKPAPEPKWPAVPWSSAPLKPR